jgi:hypothetical protein
MQQIICVCVCVSVCKLVTSVHFASPLSSKVPISLLYFITGLTNILYAVKLEAWPIAIYLFL